MLRRCAMCGQISARIPARASNVPAAKAALEFSGNKNNAPVSKTDSSQGIFLSHFAEEIRVKNLAISPLICYNKNVSAGVRRSTGANRPGGCNYSTN